jgi:hypothetical protein
MHSWLRGYLYIVLLMCISSSSFALEVTQKDKDMGGFAFPVICSAPSDLTLCVKSEDGLKAACDLYSVKLPSTYGFSYSGTYGTYPNINCLWEGKNPVNGNKSSASQPLTFRNGLCPVSGSPPPVQVIFSRNGRWFSQELSSKRCFRSCEYSNGQSFDYKHYVFTNGVMTNFTEKMDNRLTSNALFCENLPEPSRNDQGEINYEAGCEDNMFKVFCDFVEWFRSDSEMPEAPKVDNNSVPFDSALKTDRINMPDNFSPNTTCFEPVTFRLYLPFSRDEVEQEISFISMCSKLEEFGNLWRAFYLLGALFIIFRK